MHSSMSEQIGSFSRPSLHSHIKLPIVFKQFALVAFPSPQFPLFSMHSSMSLQTGGTPSNPALHSHLKLPKLFIQVALLPQPPFSMRQSFISEQIGSFSKPSLHSHIKLPIV